jgi:hypothetical protein
VGRKTRPQFLDTEAVDIDVAGAPVPVSDFEPVFVDAAQVDVALREQLMDFAPLGGLLKLAIAGC